MTDTGPNLEAREFSVRTPGRIEHIGVRRRDWDEIKNGIGNCQKANSWLSNCGWTLIGGVIGGLFGLAALTTVEKVPAWLGPAMWAATIGMAVLAVVIFLLDKKMSDGAVSAVQNLRQKMDSIVEESDREDAI